MWRWQMLPILTSRSSLLPTSSPRIHTSSNAEVAQIGSSYTGEAGLGTILGMLLCSAEAGELVIALIS